MDNAAEAALQSVLAENEALRARLAETEAILRAIKAGEVDALMVETPEGERVFTMQGADRPYRALVESMNEGAVTLIGAGEIGYANRRFATLVESPLEQLVGKRFESFIEPTFRAGFIRVYQSALASAASCEAALRRVSGGTTPVLLSLSPTQIEGVDAVSVIVTDLTATQQLAARRHAEKALQERNDQLALLARTSGLLILGEQREPELLDTVFAEIAGLLGMETYYHYEPTDESRALRLVSYAGASEGERELFASMRLGELLCGRVAQSRRRLIVEDLQHSDIAGSEVLAGIGAKSYAGFPLLARGQLLGTIAFVSRKRKDFREAELQTIHTICDQVATTLERAHLAQKLANSHDTLRRSEERLRLALEGAELGSWDVDLISDAVVWNCRHAELLGVAGNAKPSLERWHESIHMGDLERVTVQVEQARKTRGLFSVEHRLREDGVGMSHWIALYGRFFYDERGEPVRFSGVSRDITDQKRSEQAMSRYAEELKEADRQKDRFLAMLAHELRNPLAPIRNAVTLLRAKKDASADECERMYAMIGRQTEHLTRLVDDLLDASRVSRGKITLHRAPLDVVEAVHQAIDFVRPGLDAKRHQLSLHLPERGEVWVDADETRLVQAFGNLLANAAKYTDAAGKIDVTVKADDGSVGVVVRDNGIGIPPELLPQVFGLFVQAERSVDRAQGGLGIGLSVVKSLVELHGGKVQATSRGLGQGSEFTILLPRCEAPQVLQEAQLSEDHIEPRRILVVDDNVDAADSIAALLELDGHKVLCAYNGRKALEVAAAFQPEVALLDIGMPEMDGYALASALRQLPNAGKCVFMALTGYGQDQDREATGRAGFAKHLAKPADPQVLRQAIGAAWRPG